MKVFIFLIIFIWLPKLNNGKEESPSDTWKLCWQCCLFRDFYQLQRANSNWKSQWDKMEQKHQIALNELRSKLVMDEQEISNLKSRLAEQSSEFESRMLEMKRQITEEEVSWQLTNTVGPTHEN